MTRAQRRAIRRTKSRLIRWLEPQPFGPILLPLLRSAWSILNILAELVLGVTVLSLFLLMLPICLPIALGEMKRDDRRRRRVVRSFPCLHCGKILGERSLELADQAWSRILDQRQQSEQTNLTERSQRIVRTLDAICPHCGHPHHFDPKLRRFVQDPSPRSIV